jgi:hypothetical protein
LLLLNFLSNSTAQEMTNDKTAGLLVATGLIWTLQNFFSVIFMFLAIFWVRYGGCEKEMEKVVVGGVEINLIVHEATENAKKVKRWILGKERDEINQVRFSFGFWSLIFTINFNM